MHDHVFVVHSQRQSLAKGVLAHAIGWLDAICSGSQCTMDYEGRQQGCPATQTGHWFPLLDCERRSSKLAIRDDGRRAPSRC